jgi:type IV pilus assembly protein PilW
MFKINSQGFSLVELLLSSFLSIFLIIAFFEGYLSIKSTYYLQTGLSQMQENGRFAVNFLNKTIRLAGYSACTSEQSNQNILQGYSSEHEPDFLKGQTVPHTDIVIVNRCIEINNHDQYTSVAYYIGDGSQKNTDGKPIYSLYEKIMGHNRQELVSDIKNMQIVYGIKSYNNDNPIQYLKADQIKDWKSVVGIKIALLLNSVENVLPKAQEYTFNGENKIAEDRRLYKEWDDYIALRNL